MNIDDEQKNSTSEEVKPAETAAETAKTTEIPAEMPTETAAEVPAEVPAETAAEAEDDLDRGDRSDFAARYNRAKEREMEKLKQEMEAQKASDSKAKNRKWWIKTSLLLVLIAFSIAMMFTITKYVGGNTVSLTTMIRGVNWAWFGGLIGIVLVAMLLESMKYSYLLKISTGKWRLKNSVKVMFLGKYYDGITPLGTGGQPFQIYYLHKKDIPAGVATSVPLVKYIVNTVVFCLIAVGFLITAHLCVDINSIGGTVIMVVAWISLACNFAIPLIIVFASLFPRAGKKLVVKTVGFLNKIRIVKRRYPTMKKYVYEMDEYRHSLKSLIREAWKLIPLVFICAAETMAGLLVPFFTVLAIAPVGAELYPELLLQILCLGVISFYSSSLIPTPGNSGANEAVTTLALIMILGDQPVITALSGWIVLFWRFFVYYIYILSGIGINIFEIIRSAVRRRRAERASKG